VTRCVIAVFHGAVCVECLISAVAFSTSAQLPAYILTPLYWPSASALCCIHSMIACCLVCRMQVNELVGELDSIEASFLEQGYTKDRNPSNSSSVGTVQVGCSSWRVCVRSGHLLCGEALFYANPVMLVVCNGEHLCRTSF
jgi:hypothetical protein